MSKLNSGGPRKKKGKGAEDGADGATTTPEGLIKAERRDIDDDELVYGWCIDDVVCGRV